MNTDSTNVMDLPPPLDLSHHFSEVTKRRAASKIKQFYKYFAIPGIGNLAGGLPHPSYFPFDTLESSSALPTRFKPTPNTPVKPPNNNNDYATEETTQNKKKKDKGAYLNDPTPSHVLVPHTTHETNPLKRIDLDSALQYGTAQGYPALYTFIREFATTRLNPNIPYKGGAEVILTCGSTDGFAKAIECFTNPWIPSPALPNPPIEQREGLLCEEFAYMNAVQTARPRGLNVAPIAIDAEGMLAFGHERALYNVLDNWDVQRDGGKRPHIMYTVTMGQNPTSGLLSVKRRKEIYSVCSKFDVLIVEDDPYFYIQFPHAANEFSMKHRDGALVSANHHAESGTNYQESLTVSKLDCKGERITCKGKSSGSEFIDSLVPSYLSVDTEGRVIRLDTFSKTIAPGCRLGWITAQPSFIERIQRITEVSTQQPSGFVQSMVGELLIGPDKDDQRWEGRNKDGQKEKQNLGWKIDGWIRWLEGLRGNYERRMRVMCEVLEEGKTIMTSSKVSGAAAAASQRKRLPIRSRYRNIASIDAATSPSASTADDFELLSKTQIFDFVPPMAGMFLWVHMDYTTHPCYGKIPNASLAHAHWIHQTLPGYRVLSAPGAIFAPTDEIRDDRAWQYYRLCFAAIDEELVKTSSASFVRSCHDFWDLDQKEIEKILKDDEENQSVDALVREEVGKWMVSPLMC